VRASGRILDQAIYAAELERLTLDATNAVKFPNMNSAAAPRFQEMPIGCEIRQSRLLLDREVAMINPNPADADTSMGLTLILAHDRNRLLHWLDGLAVLRRFALSWPCECATIRLSQTGASRPCSRSRSRAARKSR
jgi:hypothetical protein